MSKSKSKSKKKRELQKLRVQYEYKQESGKMRYSKTHKTTTRRRILKSAQELFLANGFDATSIEDIMTNCGLTRGGFYSHFSSKSELYQEAIANTDAGKIINRGNDTPKRFDNLIENLERGCDLGILTNDVGNNSANIKTTYTNSLKTLIETWRSETNDCDDDALLSTAALLIGATAISKTTNDDFLKTQLLSACKNKGSLLSKAVRTNASLDIFWEPSPT